LGVGRVGLASLTSREHPRPRGQLRGHVDDLLTRSEQPLGHVVPDPAAALDRPDPVQLWRGGLAALDDHGMAQPLGPMGGPYADDSMAALALHVSRETMHHGGEIGVLRDLYRRIG